MCDPTLCGPCMHMACRPMLLGAGSQVCRSWHAAWHGPGTGCAPCVAGRRQVCVREGVADSLHPHWPSAGQPATVGSSESAVKLGLSVLRNTPTQAGHAGWVRQAGDAAELVAAIMASPPAKRPFSCWAIAADWPVSAAAQCRGHTVLPPARRDPVPCDACTLHLREVEAHGGAVDP